MKILVIEKYEATKEGICTGWAEVNKEFGIKEIESFLEENKCNRICLNTGSTLKGKDYSLETFRVEFEEEIRKANFEPELFITNPTLKKHIIEDIKDIFKNIDIEEEDSLEIPNVEIAISYDHEEDKTVNIFYWLIINGNYCGEYERLLANVWSDKEAGKHIQKTIKYLNKDKNFKSILEHYKVRF